MVRGVRMECSVSRTALEGSTETNLKLPPCDGQSWNLRVGVQEGETAV